MYYHYLLGMYKTIGKLAITILAITALGLTVAAVGSFVASSIETDTSTANKTLPDGYQVRLVRDASYKNALKLDINSNTPITAQAADTKQFSLAFDAKLLTASRITPGPGTTLTNEQLDNNSGRVMLSVNKHEAVGEEAFTTLASVYFQPNSSAGEAVVQLNSSNSDLVIAGGYVSVDLANSNILPETEQDVLAEVSAEPQVLGICDDEPALPVCGQDGVTYDNTCAAAEANVVIACAYSCPCAEFTTTSPSLVSLPISLPAVITGAPSDAVHQVITTPSTTGTTTTTTTQTSDVLDGVVQSLSQSGASSTLVIVVAAGLVIAAIVCGIFIIRSGNPKAKGHALSNNPDKLQPAQTLQQPAAPVQPVMPASPQPAPVAVPEPTTPQPAPAVVEPSQDLPDPALLNHVPELPQTPAA